MGGYIYVGAAVPGKPHRRVLWVGLPLSFSCMCRVLGIRISILKWSNKMQLVLFIIFIDGSICDDHLYVSSSLKRWAVSKMYRNVPRPPEVITWNIQ